MHVTRALATAAFLFGIPSQAQQAQADDKVLAPGLPRTLEIPRGTPVKDLPWDADNQSGQRCLRMDLEPGGHELTATKLDPKNQSFIIVAVYRNADCSGKPIFEGSNFAASRAVTFQTEGGTFAAQVRSQPGPVALGLKSAEVTKRTRQIGRGLDMAPIVSDQVDATLVDRTSPAPSQAAVQSPLPGDPADWGILSRTVGRFYRDNRVAGTWYSFRWSEEDQKLFRQDFTFGLMGISEFEFRVTKKGKLKCEAVNAPIFQTIKLGPDGEFPLGSCGMGMKIVDGILKTGFGTEMVEATAQEYAAAYQKQVASVAAWEQRQEAERQARKGTGSGLFGTLLGAAVGGVAAAAGGADTATAADLIMKGAAVTSGNAQMAAAMAKGSAEVAVSDAQMEAQLQGSINRGLAQGNAQYRAAQGQSQVGSENGQGRDSLASQSSSSGSAAAAPSGDPLETLYYFCSANAKPLDGGPRDDWYLSRIGPVQVSTRGGAQDLVVTPPWREYITSQVPGAFSINCYGRPDRAEVEAQKARIKANKWTSHEVDYAPRTR